MTANLTCKGAGVDRDTNRRPLGVSEAPHLHLTIWSRKPNRIPGMLLQELGTGGGKVKGLAMDKT